MILSFIILQQSHLIWTNIFFYLFVVSLLMTGIIILICTKRMANKNKEIKQIQSQYTAKIDTLRRDHNEKYDQLRNEMLKKEEERTRQWMESEKETLTVLNGISHILELSDNIAKIESDKILNKIADIKEIIQNDDNHEENEKTKRSE